MDARALIGRGFTVAAVVVWIGTALGRHAPAAIRTSDQARQESLGHAAIWRTPTALSPAELRQGPPDVFPFSAEQALSDDGIRCTFAASEHDLGGASPKFLCRTADGTSLR